MNKKNIYTLCALIAVCVLPFFIPLFPMYDEFRVRFVDLEAIDAFLYSLMFYAFQVGFWFLFNYAFDVASFDYDREITDYKDPEIPSVNCVANKENIETYKEKIIVPSEKEVRFENAGLLWFYTVSLFSIPCLSVSAALVERFSSAFVSVVLFAISCYLGHICYKKCCKSSVYFMSATTKQKRLTADEVEYIIERGYGKEFQKLFGLDERYLKNIIVVLERSKHYDYNRRSEESRKTARIIIGIFVLLFFLII